jgi:hypothetical protein
VLKVLVISKFYLKHLKELVQKLKREQKTNQFQKQVKLQRLLFGPVKKCIQISVLI